MTKEELRESRELAIKILYTHDLIKEDINLIYTQYNVVNSFTRNLVENVKSNQEKIDIIIENNLTEYNLTRLNYVDRSILRVAVSEMLHELDPKIAINEAIDISKKYTQIDEYNSASFNNKLLDKISKDILSGKN